MPNPAGTQRRAQRTTSAQIRELTTYGRHSPNSFFLDLARAKLGRGEADEARERLRRHTAAMMLEAPLIEAEREARATRLLEQAMQSDSRSARAYEEFLRMDRGPVFERRFMSRVDGQGGWFVPPAWLVEDFVPYARPKRVLANLLTVMPLPQGTDSINVPRIVVGTATGIQGADAGMAGGRDLQDGAILNVPVRTVAAISDVSLQVVEQSSLNSVADELIGADLMQDYDSQLSGLLMVGSGINGQPLGLVPGGVVGTSAAINVANSGNAASQTFYVASTGTTLYQSMMQAASKIATTRAIPSDQVHFVINPWQGEQLLSLTTTTGAPVITSQSPDLLPGQAAWFGPHRVFTDPALPTTFGATIGAGTSPPTMGALSAGQFPVQPGTGASAVYSIGLAGRFADSWLLERVHEVEVMEEVLSGDLQVRFRLKSYVAFLPARYVTASAVGSVAAAGAAISYGVVNQYQTNSPWQLSSSGF